MPASKDRLHGTLDALVLKTLTFGPRHGYAIVRWLREQTHDALSVEEGSLYPALYRMERDGWIEADWGTSELGRKAKFYQITEQGPTAAACGDEGVRQLRRRRRAAAAARVTSRRRWPRLWRTSVEDEVESELAFHLEMTTRELDGAGNEPRECPRSRPSGALATARPINAECRRYGEERDRSARRAEYRARAAPGRHLRRPAALRDSRLHDRRRRHARVRHRRHGGGLQCARRGRAPAAALRRSPTGSSRVSDSALARRPIHRRRNSSPIRDVRAFDHVAAAVLQAGITLASWRRTGDDQPADA